MKFPTKSGGWWCSPRRENLRFYEGNPEVVFQGLIPLVECMEWV